MTIDDLIQKRNQIQLTAETISEDIAQECWIKLGVANRHLERVIGGVFSLFPALEAEIDCCLMRAQEWITTSRPQ